MSGQERVPVRVPIPVRVLRVGRSALLLEAAGDEEVADLYAELTRRQAEGALGAVAEVVPAARTVLLDGVDRPDLVAAMFEGWQPTAPTAAGGPPVEAPTTDVPTVYDGADLAEVAELWGVSAEAAVRIHAEAEYRVAFCGFAPGFAYLTGLPARYAVPRRATPRTRVPAGSVALAGTYTGVYPGASPGGWHLLGHTTLPLWDPTRDPAALLTPGTRVRFRPLSAGAPGGAGQLARTGEPGSVGEPAHAAGHPPTPKPVSSAHEPGAPDRNAATGGPGDGTPDRAVGTAAADTPGTGPAGAGTTDPGAAGAGGRDRGAGTGGRGTGAPDPVVGVDPGVPGRAAAGGGSGVGVRGLDARELGASVGRGVVVVRGGPLTTVQDGGRGGVAALGVPRAGALDPEAFRLANLLVGNPAGAAVLETTLGGVGLRALAPLVAAVVGAPAPVRVDGRAAAWGAPVRVPAGGLLEVGAATGGLRGWVALSGGVDVPRVLGSRSADLLSGLGPTPLAAGQVLALGPVAGPPYRLDALPLPGPPRELLLRLDPGPRDDWFTAGSLRLLATAAYAVSPASNRVGLRLTGPPLERVPGRGELPSEGMVLGAVQVPPDGLPVVFLADHPTTGGYPVVGVVRAEDLAAAAQATPGTPVRFLPSTR